MVTFRSKLGQLFRPSLVTFSGGSLTIFVLLADAIAVMACVESLHPLLRSAAPTLSRRFFTPIRHQRLFRSTHHCSNSSAFTYQPAFKAQKQTPFLAAFRNQSTTASVGTAKLAANASSAIASSPATPSTLSRIQHGLQVLWNPFPHIGEKSAAEKGKYFPVFTRRIVAYWLFGSAVSVFGIVVFGGLTRLTESGCGTPSISLYPLRPNMLT